MRKSQKRVLATLGVGVIVLAAAGGAFAYWTQSGSGNASGTVGTTGTITLAGTFPSAQLYPGGSVPVTLTAANSGTSAVTVANVHTVVTTSDPACLASDFSMADVAQNVVVPAGATAQPLNGGTLAMANTAANQDACKSATLTLTLTST